MSAKKASLIGLDITAPKYSVTNMLEDGSYSSGGTAGDDPCNGKTRDSIVGEAKGKLKALCTSLQGQFKTSCAEYQAVIKADPEKRKNIRTACNTELESALSNGLIDTMNQAMYPFELAEAADKYVSDIISPLTNRFDYEKTWQKTTEAWNDISNWWDGTPTDKDVLAMIADPAAADPAGQRYEVYDPAKLGPGPALAGSTAAITLFALKSMGENVQAEGIAPSMQAFRAITKSVTDRAVAEGIGYSSSKWRLITDPLYSETGMFFTQYRGDTVVYRMVDITGRVGEAVRYIDLTPNEADMMFKGRNLEMEMWAYMTGRYARGPNGDGIWNSMQLGKVVSIPSEDGSQAVLQWVENTDPQTNPNVRKMLAKANEALRKEMLKKMAAIDIYPWEQAKCYPNGQPNPYYKAQPLMSKLIERANQQKDKMLAKLDRTLASMPPQLATLKTAVLAAVTAALLLYIGNLTTNLYQTEKKFKDEEKRLDDLIAAASAKLEAARKRLQDQFEKACSDVKDETNKELSECDMEGWNGSIFGSGGGDVGCSCTFSCTTPEVCD